jgi:uncharacterized membrane protein
MSPTTRIALLWLAFAGSHLMLSSAAIRRWLVARTGEGPFRGLYSLIALALFVPLVWTYFANKHAGAWLWVLPRGPALRWGIYIGMGLAFVLAVASFVQPSPAGVVPGRAEPRGVYLITRHPLLMGIALFGLLHLVPNSTTADVAFFGGFALFSVIGAAHQDRRKLADDVPGFREFYAATPFFPFTGRHTLRGLGAFSPTVAAAGIVTTIVVRWFHASWFGG